MKSNSLSRDELRRRFVAGYVALQVMNGRKADREKYISHFVASGFPEARSVAASLDMKELERGR